MPTAHVNGVRLNYLQSGPDAGGPEVEDLVMVHGLATNMAFWYFRYAPRFAKKYRVTLFDLRGHGHSEMPGAGYTPQDLGADVSGLLDHLGIARAHFVAHSFGGVAVLNMACEAPERVASLVLADTHIGAARHGSRHRWGHAGNIQAILDAHQIPLDTADPYFGYRLLTAVAHLQLNGQEVPAPLMELVSPLIGRYGKRTAAQWLKLMDTTRAEAELLGDDSLTLQRLRHLQFPILAMYGDQSQARLTGAELLEVWPHAEFRRVRDAGHFFPTTRPDEVIGACEKFWAGEYAARPRHRAGDQKKSHFRSDRVYQHDGAWYCMTREQTRLGPFSSPELVSERLAQYIASVSSTEIAA
jgi:pimeloyl-ACP methyl ester carboxylesterase